MTAFPNTVFRSPAEPARSLEVAGLSAEDVETVLDALATVIAVNGQADPLVTVNRLDFESAAGTCGFRLVSPAAAVRRLRRTP